MSVISTSTKGIALALAIATAGCGGGGGSGGGGGIASSTLSGVAATGAALANANVSITNSSGASPCVETTITTSALGSYTCTLKSGQTAPFFIVVTDPTGNTQPLVSVATTTPAAGAALTVNATSLTTAILAQVAGGDAMTLVNSHSVNASTLATVTANIIAQLRPLLDSINAPSSYDPFATSITAASTSGTGNTADLVLDMVKISTSTSTGKLTLTTSDGQSQELAGTSSGSALSALDSNVSTLSTAVQALATNLQACFALPTAQRALTTDTTIAATAGGSSVTSMAAVCQNQFATAGGPAAVDYLHNGYSAGQSLYDILTSDSMTNAKFSVPEIVLYNANTNKATLNVRYLDNTGTPGNFFTVIKNIANGQTSAHPSTWWLVGNQAPADIKIKLQIRRVQQFNASSTDPNWASTFQSGVQFNINAKGPGSVLNGANLAFVRITGPGLPTGGGLVYARPVQSGQKNMDIVGATGNISVGSRCGNPNGTTYNCPNFWMERTAGITAATGAGTLTTNQSVGVVWAQQGDGTDPSQFTKGAQYTFELFYGSNTGTADLTITKSLTSDLVRAKYAVNLPWNTAGSQLVAALDPSGSLAGDQASLTVNWTQNISAQQMGSVQFVNSNSGSYSTSISIPVGATSAVLSGVPSFASNDPGSPNTSNTPSRNINFSYRMFDDTLKSDVYRYNQ